MLLRVFRTMTFPLGRFTRSGEDKDRPCRAQHDHKFSKIIFSVPIMDETFYEKLSFVWNILSNYLSSE